MNRITKWIVIVSVLLAGVWLINRPENRTSATIEIGAVYDFTGVFADGGKAFQEGSEIALEEINAQGGIQGKKLKIIYEDDPNQEAKAGINSAQKLIRVNKVKGIVTTNFSGMSGMQTLAESAEVPIINSIDASDKIAPLGDWLFGSGIYDEGQGFHVADFAKQQLNLKKVAVLAGKDMYLLTVAEAFEKKFKELGGEITTHDEFLVGETDFKTLILKAKNSGAEAIFFSHLGEGGVGIKQARELGFTGYFLGTDTMSIADVKKIAGENALNNKTFFALWKNFDALTPAQTKFAERYQAKYQKEAGDYLFYNVLGYDGVMVLAEALKNSDLTGKSIKTALYNIKNFPGLSGPISLDETGINRDPKSAIVMYKNGNIVRAK
jgi:branched-chain amino acid transport system substrate-binding protein